MSASQSDAEAWPDVCAPVVSGSASSAAALGDYFRCPEALAAVVSCQGLSSTEGYFRLGDAIGYGRTAGVTSAPTAALNPPDLRDQVVVDAGVARLPFDLGEAARNLQEERYCTDESQGWFERVGNAAVLKALYYSARPVLPVWLRKYLQKLRFKGWENIPFPRWPVDTSVDALMRASLAAVMKARGVRRLPFIWFWPDGRPGCVMVTHDVEGETGRRFCQELMDLDDSFGIKSAFQVVPAMHGESWTELLRALRTRGFEVNIHDLRHDGYLFHDREGFRARAAQINTYAREFNCRGFRSGAMYRQQRWYDLLELSYDMSVPNGAHLEPQRGGCCTVMPYFVGKVLELPLTTAQDYTLFHILGKYSTSLWRQQIRTILDFNGLVTLLAHPDYLVERRAKEVYQELLQHVAQLRDEAKVWVALPAEVDRWWRNRRSMTLVPDGSTWRIEGPGSERARLAHASLQGDRLAFELDNEVFLQ